MADHLIRRLTLAAAAVTAAGLSPMILAEGADPTRPANVAEASASAGSQVAAGLQAVLLRPNGRSVAVINGQTVAVGDKVGDARLVSLTANQAVLSGPEGKEVLKLAPAAEKAPAAAAATASKSKKRVSGRGESHE